MLDQPSRDRPSPQPRHIRLVDGAIMPSTDPGPPSDPVTSDRKKKGKERRNKLKDEALTKKADKGGNKKGHRKRIRSPNGFAAELARLDGTLAQLRDRLFDLRSVQLDHAEANASLGRRLEDLGGLAAVDGERRELLARRLGELAAVVEALGSRVSVLAQDPRLDALVERIVGAEAALSALGDEFLPPARAHLLLGEMEGRLAALQGVLDAQANRLDRAEQGLAVALRPAAESSPPVWSTAIDGVRIELDGRIAGLADTLELSREQTQERRELEQRWTDRRMRRLGRGLAAAMVLLGLVTGALHGADWWRTQQGMDRTAARLQALEGRPAYRVEPSATLPQSVPSTAPDVADIAGISARLESLESDLPSSQAPPLSDDLLNRLRRLEAGLLETGRDLAESRAAGDALSLRLTDLVRTEQAVLQRLDALQRETAATDTRLALLDARVSAIAKPAGETAAPVQSPEPGVLEAPRYAIQLVAYTSRARIGPFTERYGIADQASAIATRVSGRPAYAVVLGRYASEAEARESIAGLTRELRALAPLVRRLPAGTRLYPVD